MVHVLQGWGLGAAGPLIIRASREIVVPPPMDPPPTSPSSRNRWRLKIDDWPDWHLPGLTVDGYSCYVKARLEEIHRARWQQSVSCHSVPVPPARLIPSISTSLERGLLLKLHWDVLHLQRAHARLRCGLVELGHLHGKISKARVVSCIRCDTAVSHLWAHVFGDCCAWANERRSAVQASALSDTRSWDIMFKVLTSTPDNPGYVECLRFIGHVVTDAERFWTNMHNRIHAVTLACTTVQARTTPI